MTYAEISQALTGLTNEELIALNASIAVIVKTRQKERTRAAIAVLDIGDRIRLANIRPRDYEGKTGSIVVGKPAATPPFYWVLVDGERNPVRVHASSIELIEPINVVS